MSAADERIKELESRIKFLELNHDKYRKHMDKIVMELQRKINNLKTNQGD